MTRDSLDMIAVFRNELRARIGVDRFELWFQGKIQFRQEGDLWEVVAGEPFILQRVQRQFQQTLGEVLRNCVGPSGRLQFRLDPEAFSSAGNADLPRAEQATGGTSEARGVTTSAGTADLQPELPGKRPASASKRVKRDGRKLGRGETVVGASDVVGDAGSVVHNGCLETDDRTPGPKGQDRDQMSGAVCVQQVAGDGLRVQQTGQGAWLPTRMAASVSGEGGDVAATRRGRRFERFDSFVVGRGNRIAFSAAQSVAERPGIVTPLFFHGPSGSGKTHLLESIYSATRKVPGMRVLYLSSEQFTTNFLEALRGGGLPSFRRKVREIDLLVVDDLQFLLGKKATLGELLHTIDALVRAGRQIVMAADRSPGRLQELGAELGTRLTGGLVCGLEEADESTREGMVSRFAMESGVLLPPEVMQLVARELSGDGRLIHGACWRLKATSLAWNTPVTFDLAREALSDLLQSHQRVVLLSDIERVVCEECGVTSKMLREESRSRAGSHPRMLAMWLARKHTRAASAEISQFFGRRSHSTVISAEQKVERWKTDESVVHVGNGSFKVSEILKRIEKRLRSVS